MKITSRDPQPFIPKIYQEWGIAHLYENDNAALFAGMGIGKTAMTLAAISERLIMGSCRSFLVVAPMRVANLVWANEAAQWEEFSWMKVANLRTKEGMKAYQERSAQIYTINYEMLPKFSNMLEKEKREKGNFAFDGIVWDELSKAKNPQSVRVECIRKFWDDIDVHWGLTGTPAPNGQMDLFAQIRLLDKGLRLGDNFFKFRSTYFYATDFEQRHWVSMRNMKQRLEAVLADIVLVLKSSDWLDIPDTIVEDIEVVLPDSAKELYKEFAKELYMLLEESEIEALNAAVLMNKLLQITSGCVYDTEKRPVVLHDAKVKALRKVFDTRETPMLVAYMYRHEMDRIRKAFPEAHFLADAKSLKSQNEMVDRWNAGEIEMLVLSPQSAGHGLNLQDGGSELVWFSLTWSRELYDQLNARLARLGQTKVCKIYRLICPKTADDAVASVLEAKGNDQSALLDALYNFKELQNIEKL